MNSIAVSQRVVEIKEFGERRDALDQRWTDFLYQCDLLPLIVPNHPKGALRLLEEVAPTGILLTGGDNLVSQGGTTPERDETELLLLAWARERAIPVLGICRGMQLLQSYYGIPLDSVKGHVATEHLVQFASGSFRDRKVNSFHRLGATCTKTPLEILGIAEDGVVEAIRHRDLPLWGMMWHPERAFPYSGADLELVRTCFSR